MLLKEEACNHTHRTFNSSVPTSKHLCLSAQHCRITLSRRGGRCFLRRLWRLRSLEAVLCSVALLNLQHQIFIHLHHTQMSPSPCPKPLPHLLMVSSSSESQKLVVSSSLLIMVLELSYPARWRSSRLWPFMRGPERPQRSTCWFRPGFSVFIRGLDS